MDPRQISIKIRREYGSYRERVSQLASEIFTETVKALLDAEHVSLRPGGFTFYMTREGVIIGRDEVSAELWDILSLPIPCTGETLGQSMPEYHYE